MYILLKNKAEYSYVGDPIKVTPRLSNNNGVMTVQVDAGSFIGHIYIEATLATEPTEDDWFEIQLDTGVSYFDYTDPEYRKSEGFTFRANITHIRARADRSVLGDVDATYDVATHGTLKQVTILF